MHILVHAAVFYFKHIFKQRPTVSGAPSAAFISLKLSGVLKGFCCSGSTTLTLISIRWLRWTHLQLVGHMAGEGIMQRLH